MRPKLRAYLEKLLGRNQKLFEDVERVRNKEDFKKVPVEHKARLTKFKELRRPKEPLGPHIGRVDKVFQMPSAMASLVVFSNNMTI